MSNKGFPQRLQEARIAAGISQTELANRADVAPGQINRYEAGKNMPRPHIMARLAGALGVHALWLSEGAGERETGSTTAYSEKLDVTFAKVPGGGFELAVAMDEETSALFQKSADEAGLPLEVFMKKVLFEQVGRKAMDRAHEKQLDDGAIEEIAKRVKQLLQSDEYTEQPKK